MRARLKDKVLALEASPENRYRFVMKTRAQKYQPEGHLRNKLVVVDDHHKVLSAWAEHRSGLSVAPRLLTLDHHTDTSAPFRNHLKSFHGANEGEFLNLQKRLISEIQFENPLTIATAISRLSHDEHVTTAIAAKIVSSALVIAHNAYDTDVETYHDHHIICRGVDRKPGSNKIIPTDCDAVLETFFLKEMIDSFDDLLKSVGELEIIQAPYILDIDLDYFNTRKSVQPSDATKIAELARGAGLVTIATEPDFVKSCSVESDLDSDWLLDKLIAVLEL